MKGTLAMSTIIPPDCDLYNHDPPPVWAEKSGQVFTDYPEDFDVNEMNEAEVEARGGIARSRIKAVLAIVRERKTEANSFAEGESLHASLVAEGRADAYADCEVLLQELLDDAP